MHVEKVSHTDIYNLSKEKTANAPILAKTLKNTYRLMLALH